MCALHLTRMGALHLLPTPSPPLSQSVVVVSTRPLFSLYHAIAAITPRCFFATGRPAIASACADLAAWPMPSAGLTTQASLLGVAVDVRVLLLKHMHAHREIGRQRQTD